MRSPGRSCGGSPVRRPGSVAGDGPDRHRRARRPRPAAAWLGSLRARARGRPAGRRRRGSRHRRRRSRGPGPELVFEQLGLPILLHRRQAALVHAPNCFLPLLRPCPGVVTINDLAFEAWPADFAPRTRAKFRLITRLAARSAQRIICPSRATADDVVARYGAEPARIRVIPDAPGSPQGAGAAAIVANSVRDRRRRPAGQEEPGRADRGLRRGATSGRAARAGPGRDRRRGRGPPAHPGRRASGHLHRLHRRRAPGRPDHRRRSARASQPVRGFRAGHPGGDGARHAGPRGSRHRAARDRGDAAAYFEPGDPGDFAAQLGGLLADPARRAALAAAGHERAAAFSWEATAAPPPTSTASSWRRDGLRTHPQRRRGADARALPARGHGSGTGTRS